MQLARAKRRKKYRTVPYVVGEGKERDEVQGSALCSRPYVVGEGKEREEVQDSVLCSRPYVVGEGKEKEEAQDSALCGRRKQRESSIFRSA